MTRRLPVAVTFINKRSNTLTQRHRVRLAHRGSPSNRNESSHNQNGNPESRQTQHALARYTHRVAISNSRLIVFDERGVTFRYKDYRRDGADRQQVMTLAANEFIRRFLIHVLPRGFHRIRHYGLLAGSARRASLALARELLDVAASPDDDTPGEPDDYRPSCPCCGGRMIVIETFERWGQPRGPPHASATKRETAP